MNAYKDSLNSFPAGILNLPEEPKEEPIKSASQHYFSEFSPIERRTSSDTHLFQDNQSVFSSSLIKTTHWSIAWSDLMMTMFILFLSLFVYQATHKDFLVSDDMNIIGGTTQESIDIKKESRASLPYVPVKPGLPLFVGGTVKKVEPVKVVDINADKVKHDTNYEESKNRIKNALSDARSNTVIVNDSGKPFTPPLPPLQLKQPGKQDHLSLAPQSELQSKNSNQIHALYKAAKQNINNNKLNDFISLDLITGNKLRFVISSDMLFDTGYAQLNKRAEEYLKTIGRTLYHTPYMINIIGHSDDLIRPSAGFSSNWDLTAAQASHIARFFIDELNIAPKQLNVSSFASYRPLFPNTSPANRAANRRVEILVSQDLPSQSQLTAANF